MSDIEISIALALAYAGQGWRVFPTHSFQDGKCTCDEAACDSPAKHPINCNGIHGATLDADLIREWHAETGGLCNWGIATGSGLWVLDVDPRHGGDQTLTQLEARHGPLPMTPTVSTGGGGKHFFFLAPPGLVIRSRAGKDIGLPGLDTRGEGGYVVAPPSLHQSGNRYEWLVPCTTPLAEAPAWLLALVRGEARKLEPGESVKPEPAPSPCEGGAIPGPGPVATLTVGSGPADLSNNPGVSEGSRNATLCRLVGVHLARGEALARFEGLALAWAAKCDPPFEEAKAQDTVRRLWRKHQASAATDTNTTHTANAGPEPEGLNSAPAPGPGPAILSLHGEAFHGLPGAIVRAIEPETEADPAGVLLSLLTGFANAVGRGPHFTVGARHHYPNLFAALVGETSAAKGEAWAVAHYLLSKSDPAWEMTCIAGGFGSGEGLAWRVRDAQEKQEPVKEKGIVTGFRTVLVPGGEDKRALFVETEFSKAVRLMRREGSTLSEILRRAWDGDVLEYCNKGDNAFKATDAHISIVAHVTPAALSNAQGKGCEDKDGTFSRLLWCLVRSQKDLPAGGNVAVLDRFAPTLAKAITAARAVGEMHRTAEAEAWWDSVYPGLKRSGDSVPCTEKARPQVLRLAMLYALADGKAEIGFAHLQAALALWAYCRESARSLFGGGLPTAPAPEPLAVRLLNAITASLGISRTGLREVAGHKVSAEEIEQALAWVEAQGLAHRGEGDGEGPGRKAERWWPGAKPGPEPEAGREGRNCPLPKPAEGGEGKGGREEIPSPEPAANSLPPSREPEPETRPDAGGNSLPPSPMLLRELFAQVKVRGGRLAWCEGVVSVEAVSPLPEALAQACREYQAELALLVSKPEPEPEPKAPAERCLTQEQFLAELDKARWPRTARP